MSLVTSWSAMGSMNKMMNDMKELDTVSGLPSQIRQPKILQGNYHFEKLKLSIAENLEMVDNQTHLSVHQVFVFYCRPFIRTQPFYS